MNPLLENLKQVILRLTAKSVSGPDFIINAIRTASLSVAHVLAQMLRLGIAEDLRLLKEDGLRRSKAKADAEEAKARELIAKAAEAENKATLVKRNDRISKAEEMQKLATAAKTNAEARAILSKAEADQVKSKAEAYVKLLEAFSNLEKKGGRLAVDPKNLSQLLGLHDLDDLADNPPKLPPPHSLSNTPLERPDSRGRPSQRPKKPKK
jgi:hypothetical protein